MIRTSLFIVVGLASGCATAPPPRAPAPPPPPPGSQATASAPVQQPAPAPAAPPVQLVGTAADLAFLPVDSDLVMGVSFKQLETSALWKLYSPKLMGQVAPAMMKVQLACGFDPSASVTTVTMGVKDVDAQPAGVAVVRGFDKDKLVACIDKLKTSIGATLTVDGGGYVVTEKSGKVSAFTFADDGALIALFGANASAAALQGVTKRSNSLTKSPVFMELFGRVDQASSVWLLINGNASFMKSATTAGVHAKALVVSVTLTDRLSGNMRVRVRSADDANQLATMVNGQIASPQVKAMFDKLQVDTDGADVRLSLEIGDQKLAQLVGLFGGMLGGMGATDDDPPPPEEEEEPQPKTKTKTKAKTAKPKAKKP